MSPNFQHYKSEQFKTIYNTSYNNFYKKNERNIKGYQDIKEK